MLATGDYLSDIVKVIDRALSHGPEGESNGCR
jgi:hypothetical protein